MAAEIFFSKISMSFSFVACWELRQRYISICVYTYIVQYETRLWGRRLFNRRGRREVARRYLGGGGRRGGQALGQGEREAGSGERDKGSVKREAGSGTRDEGSGTRDTSPLPPWGKMRGQGEIHIMKPSFCAEWP
jgi:hypothetical protein